MVSFLIAAGVLLAIAIAMLSWRLWKAPAGPVAADEAVDALGVLRDQKRELDNEVAAGRMTFEEREMRLVELTRRVHEEGLAAPQAATAAHDPDAAAPLRRRLWLAALVTLLVPAIAIPVYLLVGNPTALDPAMLTANSADGSHGEMTPDQVRTILDQLKAKLEKTPDDVKGWTMLGRGLRLVDDFAGSAAAFDKANALAPGNAQLLADYADSLAMAQGRSLQGRPSELIQQALKADPKLPKALALAASAEFAQGKFAAAKGYWQRLLEVVPADSESANEVRAILAQLDTRIAGGAGAGQAASASAAAAASPTASTSAGAASGAAKAAAKEPAASPTALASGTSSAVRSGAGAPVAAISGTVKLSPALATKVAAGDTLFIFARAVDGPRMPLAIIRGSASELPRAFKLDDALGMAGGPALSSIAQVRIEARVSKTGEAMPKPGDLRGESAVVAPGMSNIDIVIDNVVP